VYAPLCGISRSSLPRCKVTRSRLRKPTLSFVEKFPVQRCCQFYAHGEGGVGNADFDLCTIEKLAEVAKCLGPILVSHVKLWLAS
jgi:hypothetical protein